MESIQRGIVAFVILAAVGLFFMMPRGKASLLGRLGLFAIIITLICGSSGVIQQSIDVGIEKILFTLFGGISILSSVLMICQRKALYSALYFVLTIVSVAALFILQDAEFLGVALILVYAGAIMVTYVFVLTLCKQEGSDEYERKAAWPLMGILMGFTLLGAFTTLLFDVTLAGSAINSDVAVQASAIAIVRDSGTTLKMGIEIFKENALALEIAGVLLLVAAIGGIAMIKQAKVNV